MNNDEIALFILIIIVVGLLVMASIILCLMQLGKCACVNNEYEDI